MLLPTTFKQLKKKKGVIKRHAPFQNPPEEKGVTCTDNATSNTIFN